LKLNELPGALGKLSDTSVSKPLPPSGPGAPFLNVLKERIAKGSEATSTTGETVQEYIVKPGDTLWKIGMEIFKEDPYKIAKANGIVNPDLIYPGQKLRMKRRVPETPQQVTASWYGKQYHNRPTASGEIFNMYHNTLAHKTLPLGTRVKLINPETGEMAIGKINDRGPFIEGRDVDLSFGLAERLGMVQKGVGKLIMEII